MQLSKNYRIKGLKRRSDLCEGAKIIIRRRFRTVIKKVKSYLIDPSVENLHKLRVSIRRVRYSLENFGVCYSTNEFLMIIEYTKFLQDLIGEARDLDVLPEKINNLENEIKIHLPERLYAAIEDKKSECRLLIKEELYKFLSNKTIKDFFISN